MQSILKKATALLIALLMVCPLVACGNDDGTDNPQVSQAEEAKTENETEAYFPNVEKTNYGTEFTAIYCSDTFRPGYYFIEEEDRQNGNDMDDNVYERMKKVEDYLGVDIVSINAGNYMQYSSGIKKACNTNDNAYQLVMTHVYIDVATMITGNMFLDFNSLESINLDAPYWNKGLMEELAINDAMYCGYNDFCLSQCYLMAFNKDLYTKYQSSMGDLYAMVRNKEWTLDKMIEVTSLVSEDKDGNGKFDENDVYGFTGLCWVPMISFVTASDMRLVERDAETDELYVSPMVDHADKFTDLVDKFVEFNKTDACYTWFHDVPEDQRIKMSSGRAFSMMLCNFDLITLTGEDVKFGVLPYPLYDQNQENYQTLNWNGVLGVPSTNVETTKMVGDVLEMLNFWSDGVKVAFYEKLLGAKVADAPDDADMLNIIWDSQVSDIGLIFSSSSPAMDTLLYSLPTAVNGGTNTATSIFKSQATQAERALKSMFRKMNRN